MRVWAVLPLVLALGCHLRRGVGPPLVPPAPAAPEGSLAPGTSALLLDGGQERWLDAAAARAQGYTLVDLSDDFAPVLFTDHRGPDGQLAPNRYRSTFVGLANDRVDGDGQPLPAGTRNYLELFGIFPSLSVLSARFAADAGRSCVDAATAAALTEDHRRRPTAQALRALAQRLSCEGLLEASAGHKAGRFDRPLQSALRRFQLKHMIYESARLRGRTAEALSRDLLDNNHRALLRVLRERVVAAAGIIEDGSGSRADLGAALNLADDFTAAAARALNVETPDQAAAFFRRRPAGSFGRLLTAMKLPALPPHHGATAQLKLIIDRGDVFYDLPFDQAGKPLPQPRKRYPSLTLVAEHGGKSLDLVRWRTTIGGWRLEQASDGHDYYRYKGSDVGGRVLRQIVAAPVWIAPPATPGRSLVKWKPVQGRTRRVVDYAELGPGYLSAYGLVAGYLVIPGKNGRPDRDNGIRAHGSAEYLSMYAADGYSHGCHRLPNHLAIRLFSYLLRHRPMRVQGELGGIPERQFLQGEQVFEIRIPTRGYAFQLDPPLAVEVKAGTIRGQVQEPIEAYVPRPGVRYPGPPPPVPGAAPQEPPVASATP